MSNQGMPGTVPPFLSVTLRGAGGETLILTRQALESTQVKIETTSRVIYCPASEVRSALDAITTPEADQLKGN